MSAKGIDLTRGNILKKLIAIAAPIMAVQVFQMAYNLIDMFFLGRISADVVAAAGSAGMFLWLSVAFFLIGQLGAEIGVSQSTGKGDDRTARKYAKNAMLISIILGVTTGLITILFSEQLISLLRIQEPHVAHDAAVYLRIVGFGFPMIFSNNAISGIYNGVGNSKLPFYLKSIGLIFNVLITPIFIFVLGWGIVGAAIATVIGHTVTGVLLLFSVKHPKTCPFDDFRFKEIFAADKKIIKQILRWSLPISADSALFTSLTMIIAGFVAGFGSGAIAAQRVGTQIESLSWLVGGGYAAAFRAFVGQNYGALKFDRLKTGYWLSATAMTVWGLGVGFVMSFAGGPIFRLFIREPEIVAIGVNYMRILAVVQIAQCLDGLSASAFDGLGQTLPPTIVSITFNALRVVVAFFLSQTALGLDGIWMGLAFGNLMRGIVLTSWYLLYTRKYRDDK
jgi:putative MATE family efflux protein